MTLTDVPVINIAPYRTGDTGATHRVAAAVGQACRDIGFLVITGHGVPPRMIAKIDAVSCTFFDLPLAEKMKAQRPAPDITRGYIPIRAEALEHSRGTT
jgi:isopenicillin N synthase-like dioxygenase